MLLRNQSQKILGEQQYLSVFLQLPTTVPFILVHSFVHPSSTSFFQLSTACFINSALSANYDSFSQTRGFAFVTFAKTEDSLRALNELNGAEIDGRTIKVERARRNIGYEKTPGVCKFSL
jgi:RNA recognition motif-containing protein